MNNTLNALIVFVLGFFLGSRLDVVKNFFKKKVGKEDESKEALEKEEAKEKVLEEEEEKILAILKRGGKNGYSLAEMGKALEVHFAKVLNPINRLIEKGLVRKEKTMEKNREKILYVLAK